MISVEEADAIIQAEVKDYGKEVVPFDKASGRVLAEDVRADRDLPPYNRVAMDGIAFKFAAFGEGTRRFRIKATQAAGERPVAIDAADECVEIMTGAALPASVDTVVRYEDLLIENGVATIQVEEVREGQNVHFQGKDRKQHDIVAQANQVVTPALISLAAAVGATELQVKKLPKVVVISTGDELVQVHETPLPFQIRGSNSYAIQAALQKYNLQPDLLHIPDDPEKTCIHLSRCLQEYDVLILSGGISMGKYDYVPQVLEELAVKKLFHKVKQRPGKPFWFGRHPAGALVFALPGNPVSTFMCFHRYVQPWLEASLGLKKQQAVFAVLHTDMTFSPPLQYFMQVKLEVNEAGQWLATPLEGNGSGDLANLVENNAFLELPSHKSVFKQGEVYRAWPY
ncbi:molybdopterin molybdotransferase MoeA [Pontibacter sp. SGAir0037]|uniref:molybdopterin molybdotransferase MoeA n=1 Tax=Pontibacter sp. SGAir0037 TaxID=2571030 RepID=UPI0010CD1374|nr:molybdopterin molybdotransferase MoeA [Pontibacter sp. SGAir0037]QCR21439.1 molybdopterin molybdenumtransferase MoeA [Pontibacter sp. SGAir0037]